MLITKYLTKDSSFEREIFDILKYVFLTDIAHNILKFWKRNQLSVQYREYDGQPDFYMVNYPADEVTVWVPKCSFYKMFAGRILSFRIVTSFECDDNYQIECEVRISFVECDNTYLLKDVKLRVDGRRHLGEFKIGDWFAWDSKRCSIILWCGEEIGLGTPLHKFNSLLGKLPSSIIRKSMDV